MNTNNWINQIYDHCKKVYSQTYQDGIIEYIFKNIGTTNKFCVEFGFNSNSLTGGSGANVARLVLEDNWKALLLDGFNDNSSINLHKEFLTQKNICSIFKKYCIPKNFDYISIDVDSIDLWLFKAMLEGEFRPRLISIEYNANFDLDMSITVKEGTIWKNGDAVYGASLLALNKVAEEFDYCLIAAIEKYDLFFIRKELLNNYVSKLSDFQKFVGLPTHCEYGMPSTKRIESFVEYPSMNPLSDCIKRKLGWIK